MTSVEIDGSCRSLWAEKCERGHKIQPMMMMMTMMLMMLMLMLLMPRVSRKAKQVGPIKNINIKSVQKPTALNLAIFLNTRSLNSHSRRRGRRRKQKRIIWATHQAARYDHGDGAVLLGIAACKHNCRRRRGKPVQKMMLRKFCEWLPGLIPQAAPRIHKQNMYYSPGDTTRQNT